MRWTRRSLFAALALALALPSPGAADDVTFVFTNDIHACRMETGLSPNCAAEGKTDASLLRHVAAINAIEKAVWPSGIGGVPTGFGRAGQPIGAPLGVVVGGDLTDDGGGHLPARRVGSVQAQGRLHGRLRRGPRECRPSRGRHGRSP